MLLRARAMSVPVWQNWLGELRLYAPDIEEVREPVKALWNHIAQLEQELARRTMKTREARVQELERERDAMEAACADMRAKADRAESDAKKAEAHVQELEEQYQRLALAGLRLMEVWVGMGERVDELSTALLSNPARRALGEKS